MLAGASRLVASRLLSSSHLPRALVVRVVDHGRLPLALEIRVRDHRRLPLAIVLLVPVIRHLSLRVLDLGRDVIVALRLGLLRVLDLLGVHPVLRLRVGGCARGGVSVCVCVVTG